MQTNQQRESCKVLVLRLVRVWERVLMLTLWLMRELGLLTLQCCVCVCSCLLLLLLLLLLLVLLLVFAGAVYSSGMTSSSSLICRVISLGWAPLTVQPMEKQVPRISFTPPASVRARLRGRMVRAMSMTASRVRSPSCTAESIIMVSCRVGVRGE